jgi:hypothetical protein
MIQPREDIAWVRTTDGRLSPFDPDRLTQSIALACEFTGHADRLLAESVAAAIHHYICECETDRVIEATEIARIVLTVLEVLTCEDIARAYARRAEWTEIRLDELAAQASPVFELEFYRQLDATLRAASGTEEMALVHLRGLRACVMRLRGASRWGRSCRMLADDIVDFVRARVARTRPARAGTLRLEMLE